MPIGQHGAINTVERDGRFTAYCRIRCNDGRFRQLERTSKSRAKAVIALEKACEDMRTRSFGTIDIDMKLKDLADLYMADVIARRSDGTIQTYRTSIKHVKKRVGMFTIREATPARLQGFIDAIARDSGIDQAKSCKTVLSGMLAMAVRSDALRHNPVAELARIERTGKVGSDAIPLDDLPTLLDAIDASSLADTDEADVFRFMAGVGFRAGEALGLCWDCVDFKHSKLTVRRIAKRVSGKGMILQNHAKTVKGDRTITAPRYVMALLRTRLERQRTARLDNPHGLVFPMPLGGIRDVGLLDRHLRKVRGQLGCDGLRITSHSFRKTCASILHVQGVSDLEVADYLGQSDVATTQKVYIARNQRSADAARLLDDFTASSQQ